MFPQRFAFLILGLLASRLLAGIATAAPPIQATAQAARTTVQVGEPVPITIHVRDSEEMPQIDAPKLDGMSISSTGTGQVTPSALRNVRAMPSRRLPTSKLVESLRGLSKQLSDVSGTMPNDGDPQLTQQYQAMLKQRLGNLNRNDYAIVYLATPEKIGPITVPPFTIHANGQTVQTQPITLTVTEPRPSPWVKAALSLSKPEPSAGETVNLYVDLLVRRWVQQAGHDNAHLKSQPINRVILTVPSLEGYAEVQPVEPLEKYVEKRRLPPGQLGYHINHFPGVILLEQEPAGTSERLDPQWYRRRLTIPFRAVQAGEMEVPPLRVAGEVYIPSTGKDRYIWEGFVASSPPLKFRIHGAANRATDPAPQSAGKTRQKALAAEESSPALANTDSPTKSGNWPPAMMALAAAAAALLVLTPMAVALRRRLAGRRQRFAHMSQQRQAIDAARERLRTSLSTAAEVSAAMQDFLRAYLEMASGEITPEEAAESLSHAGYSIEVAETFAAVLRACATRQFAPAGDTDDRDIKTLALTAGRMIDEILTEKPREPLNPPAPEDELTRERQVALAD